MKTTLPLAVMIIFVTLATAPVSRAEAPRQSTKAWNFQPVNSEKEFNALPDNTTIAMACSMCKSIMVMEKRDIASKPSRGKEEVAVMVHQCPGCGGKMTRKLGTKETKWIHTCSQCGDQSAFCCSTSPGKATPGM